MRTTLDIAPDVLEAARAIARQRGMTLGETVSDLARQALRRPAGASERNGVPLLTLRDPTVRVTLEQVNALRDETP